MPTRCRARPAPTKERAGTPPDPLERAGDRDELDGLSRAVLRRVEEMVRAAQEAGALRLAPVGGERLLGVVRALRRLDEGERYPRCP
jgi:hypothetical protein